MDDREYDFYECDQLAIIGEEKTAKILSKKGFTNIRNVRKDKKYQQQDIDILAIFKGAEYRIEVKADKTKYKNIFYEVISNDVKNTIGCMRKTNADYLVYYFILPSRNIAYVFNVQDFRLWAELYIKEKNLVLKPAKNKHYKSWGYLIPISEIIGKSFVKVWDYKKYE